MWKKTQQNGSCIQSELSISGLDPVSWEWLGTHITGDEQKTKGYYRWGKISIGKPAWFPAIGHDKMDMTVRSVQGDKKTVIAQLEGSLLSLSPRARSSPHSTEAQLHIQQAGTTAAQRQLRAVISLLFPPHPSLSWIGATTPCGGGPRFVLILACCC